jgi:hypothetical protein
MISPGGNSSGCFLPAAPVFFKIECMHKRKIIISLLLAAAWSAGVSGQPVNEDVTVSLQQAPLLRVDVGPDETLGDDGTVVIGENIYITGGTSGFSYVWNDVSQNSYEEATPEVTVAGTYLLTVTDANNCTAIDSLHVLPNTSTAAGELLRAQVSVRVDHGNRAIEIEVINTTEAVVIAVYAIDGRLAAREEIPAGTGATRHRAATGTFTTGVYVLHVQSGTAMYSDKLIIQ